MYPVDEPMMAITVDPIVPSPSKVTSVSPSLVAVSIDEPIPVLNDEAELEKLVESSDRDIDEVICFRSLCSVMIPEIFLSAGTSTADIVANNPVYHITLVLYMITRPLLLKIKVKTIFSIQLMPLSFMMTPLWAQMDSEASMSVTNLINLLHNVKFFDVKFKSNVCIHGVTSKLMITPRAVECMRVCALTRQGFIDVNYYFLPHFSTTLLSHVSVIKDTGQPEQYISKGMQLFFVPSEVVLDQDLMSNSANFTSINYNHLCPLS